RIPDGKRDSQKSW
ncbi:hypothetical protein A2U01_0040849, partial [Trifolium medium]|nr:hypothetical protein [Trifolium medium]